MIIVCHIFPIISLSFLIHNEEFRENRDFQYLLNGSRYIHTNQKSGEKIKKIAGRYLSTKRVWKIAGIPTIISYCKDICEKVLNAALSNKDYM